MSNQSPIIKFGITADGKRSSYWRLRAGAKQPELFLEREAYGKNWLFSLHASGQWHMKESGKARITWTRPPEVVPGYTRAGGIVEPLVVAHREDPAPATSCSSWWPLTPRRARCSASSSRGRART